MYYSFRYYCLHLAVLFGLIFIGMIPSLASADTCLSSTSAFGDESQFLKTNPTVFGFTATRFTPSADCTVSSVGVKVYQNFSSNAHLEIYSDAVGVPDVSIEDCGAIPGMTGSMAWATTTCSGTTVLSSGTPYWVLISGTNSGSGSEYVAWNIGNDSGATKRQLGGVWVAGDYPNATLLYTIDGFTDTGDDIDFVTDSTAPPLTDFLDQYGYLLYLLGGCFLLAAMIKLLYDIFSGGYKILGKYDV